MYEESGEARKATVPATSSGFPIRFIGTALRIPWINCSVSSLDQPTLSTMGVSIGPGATELTRILRPASAAAIERTKDRIAAFVAP